MGDRLGKLKLFHSTMGGSKSGILLMQMHNFERQGKFVLAFKPALDTRDDMIKSRAIAEGKPAYSIRNDQVGMITSIVERNAHKGISRIFVDELQMFNPKIVREIAQVAIDYHVDVYSYGLLLSYSGKIFAGIVEALECGFEMQEIKMQCDTPTCENRSTHHILKMNGEVVKSDEAEIKIGDSEFSSVCYQHFVEEYSK